MIRLENICKEYQGLKVLNNINLNFRKHELVCILGPSGSGKSTLLNIIAGNLKESSGSVYLGNNSTNDINLDYYHNKYISYIYQNYNLINNLNVIDNITLGLKLTNKKIDYNKINNILNKLNLDGFNRKNVNNLSGGEKQRVAIARSIVNNSKIILADEPTGALDTKNSINVMNILKRLSYKKLVIIVTHNEKLAYKYASRIIKLQDGNIISDSNSFDYKYDEVIKKHKLRLKLKDLIKISINNIKTKKSRNILTMIAFSIGLFSLTLVLSISNGFNKELTNLKQNTLYNYPLVISKESMSLDLSLKDNQKYDKNKININKNVIIKNNIDNKLLSKINSLNKLVDGISYYRNIDSYFKNISYINPNNNYFKLIIGSYIKNNNEVLLLVDQNNGVNENIINYLNLNSLEYKDVLGKKLFINNNTLTIVGVVKSNKTYFESLSGIIYSNNLFNNEITDIYIYPKDYNAKEKIKKILSNYNVTDDAKSVIDITSSLVKGISYILIVFSIISLLVSIIMISIISYIGVLERQQEIGIMKSLGARKKDIKKLFIIENNFIGLLSAFISILLTFVISKILNKYISKSIDINNLINLNYKIIILIIILSLVLTYIAGIIPAKKASNKRVIDILHNS